MDILTLLKDENRKLSRLFEKLEASPESADEARQELFDKLYHDLTLHVHVEEAILYPALKGRDETRSLGFEGLEEHKIIKLLLDQLASMTMGSVAWNSKFAVLREGLGYHIQGEEEEMFPRVREVFSGEELEVIGKLLETEQKAFSKALSKVFV